MGRYASGSLLVASFVAATLGVASAMHDPSITEAEFKCQAKTNKALGRFVRNKARCFQTCNRDAWRRRNSFSDCVPPYGGATARCILEHEPVRKPRGVENKFAAAIQAACDSATKPGTECPACFTGGDCSVTGEVAARVQNMEGQLDSFAPALFCETTTATPAEQICQLTTAKVLAKLAAAVNRCYDACYARAHRGDGTVAGCSPPAYDPETSACVSLAARISIDGINRRCGDVIGLGELCADWNRGGYPDGASWTNLVEIWFSGNVPGAYCSDP